VGHPRAWNRSGEGDFGWDAEVEIFRQAELGCDIEGVRSLVGVIDAGLPVVRGLEVLRSGAQGREEEVGALEVDHVGGNGLDELGEGRLHGVHRFQRRQLELDELVASAGLGHAQ